MSNRPAQGASALIAEGTIRHSSARSEWIRQQSSVNSPTAGATLIKAHLLPAKGRRMATDVAPSTRHCAGAAGRDYWLAPGRSSQPSPIFWLNTSAATSMLGSLLYGPKEHGLYRGGE